MSPKPSKPIAQRFFYGWVIVVVTFLSSMISAGLTGYGLAFFIIPMSNALNVSRAAFSSITVFRLLSLPLIPFIGVLADKKQGARLLMTFGSIAAGLALILTSTVTNIWQFYLIYGILFGLASTIMGGFVIEPALIAKWFIRHRGRAMAIGTMGISAGGVIIAPWAGWLVATQGWRTAWVALGITLLVLLTLPAALLVKRSPEDSGLLPDGDTLSPLSSINQPTQITNARPPDIEYPWTLREAVKTKALWLLLCVNMFGLIGLMPVIIHQVAYIQDKGFTPANATTIATAVAFFAMIAKLPWGYWTEKYSLRILISACGITSGLSVIILVASTGIPGLYFYAVAHGLTMGGFPTIMNVAWASFFGRQNSGAIRGAITPPITFMGFLSPAIAGWMWDQSGNYDLAFTCFAIAWIISGLIMCFTKPPKAPTYTSS